MVLFIDGANVCASVGECIPDTPQVNPLSTPLSKLPEEEEKEQHTPVPSFSPSSSPSQQHTETEITPGEEKEACVEPNSQQSLSQQEILEAAVVASESARQVWKQRDGKSREWLPWLTRQGCVSATALSYPSSMALTDSVTNDGNSIGVTTPPRKEPTEERETSNTSIGGEQPPLTNSHSSSPHPASPLPLSPADVQVS